MKSIHRFAAGVLAFALAAIPSRAAEEAADPILTLTLKSYDSFAGMITTVAKAGDPSGKENPLAELEDLFKAHPDAIDRTRPAHAAVWLNGMFQPLVAVYVPTEKFAALKKWVDGQPKNEDVSLEELDGYGLFLAGAENSLEANLAAARTFDSSKAKADHPAEVTIRFDEPTRTMLNGILAMGRLQMKQSGAEFGDAATAEMMKAVFDLYFDMFEGFIAGMEETKFTLDIADKGIRFGVRSAAKPDSTYGKLLAKSPMAPGPISENYSAKYPIAISGRIAEIDDSLAEIYGQMATLGAKISGGIDGDLLKRSTDMMKGITPMYFSFGYDFSEELTAAGIYHFGEDKDVAALYRQIVELGTETGKQMAGEGKMYSEFKHDHLTRKGTEIDRFTYKMSDAFPPNPLMGDSMKMEYAQSGNRILFSMGEDGITPLLKPGKPSPLPAFLKPDDTTVMIGHLDILSLIGTFAQLEVSHPAQPSVFIADKRAKETEKNVPDPEGKDDANPGSKILMRASLDGSLHFDLHIPLSLIRTLARLN